MSERLQLPPPPRAMPPAVREAQCLLLESIVARRPLWRSRFALFAAATVLAGGGVATALRLQPESVTDKGTARCYTSAVREDGKKFPGTTVVVANPTRPGDKAVPTAASVEDALSLCRKLWSAGALRPDAPEVGDFSPGEGHLVPPLVPCVLPNGTAAVFPGGPETCGRLGLPPIRS